MEDETQVEQPTPSPSEENVSGEEQVQEEGRSVPYDRFKEVIEEKNRYKELLAVQQSGLGESTAVKTTQEQIRQVEAETGSTYDEALKIIDSRVDEKMSKKLEAIQRQQDLDKTINQNPDFYKYADVIKAKIQENPHLSWSDAYKLSRYETSVVEAKQQGKQEAYKKMEQKRSASVESASKAKPTNTGSGEIDPLARGADGKFLYSLKELEDILPKKQ